MILLCHDTSTVCRHCGLLQNVLLFDAGGIFADYEVIVGDVAPDLSGVHNAF